MAIFGRKKRRLTFEVKLVIHELSHIPLSAGDVFVKWKLPGVRGGAYGFTEPVPIGADHRAVWGTKFPPFNVTLSVDDDTNLLDSLVLRLSVRMNTTASAAHTRLGIVELDLAEYAGTAKTSRKCLLDKSDINSSLRITMYMEQKKGDPMFRSRAPVRPRETHEPVDDDEEAADGSGTVVKTVDTVPQTGTRHHQKHRRHRSADSASVVTGGAGGSKSTHTASTGGVDPMLLRGLRAGSGAMVSHERSVSTGGSASRDPSALLSSGLHPDMLNPVGPAGHPHGRSRRERRRSSHSSMGSTRSTEESPRSSTTGEMGGGSGSSSAGQPASPAVSASSGDSPNVIPMPAMGLRTLERKGSLELLEASGALAPEGSEAAGDQKGRGDLSMGTAERLGPGIDLGMNRGMAAGLGLGLGVEPGQHRASDPGRTASSAVDDLIRASLGPSR